MFHWWEQNQTHAVYTHFCSTTDQQRGRQSTLLHREERQQKYQRNIYIYIYQHLGETQSHRTADGWRRKRKSWERKIKRRHLVLNEGMENADRNKLSDSSGPLRETDRRETVCTEVQEDKKKGTDGWMDENRGPNTRRYEQKRTNPVSFHRFWHEIRWPESKYISLCSASRQLSPSTCCFIIHLRADQMWSIDSPSFHSSETNLSVDWLSRVATLSFSGSMFFISHSSAL